MTTLVVQPCSGPLSGSVPVPSDKSIGHRALIFAGLSRGKCEIRRFSRGEDNVSTLRIFRALGLDIADLSDDVVHVTGKGLRGLSAPAGELDCGNSGTTMRLMSGILVAQPFESVLVGDASLSRRPMMRIAGPLRSRGGRVEGKQHPTKQGEITAPLRVGPLANGERLQPLEYASPVASAQVKSALLLSGLYASGPTIVSEPVVSRDHTERMLDALGVPLDTAGAALQLHPPADPMCFREFDIDLPGDLSAAAFLLVAGLIVEGSTVTVRDTGINPTRAGILDIIKHMGGTFGVEPGGDTLGEPCGSVTVRHGDLGAGVIGGELATRAIDEIPIAAALAARARGTTEFRDVAELRVKESDRIAAVVELLRAFGASAEELDDGFRVEGRADAPLRGARVHSHGDHRIAMTAAVLGTVADGETTIEDADCIRTSFPRFVGTMRALGASVEVRE